MSSSSSEPERPPRQDSAGRVARLLSALVLAACQNPAPAPTGAPPPMQKPLGPVPGAHAAVVEMPNPLRSDAAAIARGQASFANFNCGGCHGDHGGGGMGPSLRDETWIYGHHDADIFSSIAEGRAHGMPAWGTKLPATQIWELVAYIQSLRTESEPMKPDQSVPPPPAS
jgi:cytochrome c oxidase cbb3-type subunit 3